MKKHIEIRIKGIVQGVGFRPFVYRIALKNNLKGYVLNDTEGVLIGAEGEEESIKNFLVDIKNNAPPLSFIQEITVKDGPLKNYSNFSIKESVKTYKKETFIPPDTMVCHECLSEFFDPKNRRFHYPFITCTHCGPRFSIINDIPYDRENTEMKNFPMCKDCLSEYNNPLDRRFHTEPNACPVCGPHLFLYDNKGKLITDDTDEIASLSVKFLKEGKILAIKGVGGYHLSADATNDKVVHILRERKKRPFKPFAVMMGDIETVKSYFYVDKKEEEILISKERPIVLIREKRRLLSSLIAPNLSFKGIMLPYTPFQHLLFTYPDLKALIMTSGNISGEPIISDDETAFLELSHIADYFVTYNRKIAAFSDDSVVFVENETSYFIRRSRGFVPLPFIKKKSIQIPIFATGGDLKNVFGLSKEYKIILSQYLGDLSSPKSEVLYRKTYRHFKKIFDIQPKVIVSDAHPGYFTTQIAEELSKEGLEWIKVQHHHAHIVSVMEDLELKGPVIGIAFDGTGYGDDGNLWGSEFLIVSREDYKRVGHFSYFPLPGGEKAIKEIWRIGISLLYGAFSGKVSFRKYKSKNAIIELIEKSINTPLTCSIGRLFDGIANILDICEETTEEAEAAQKLENIATTGWEKDLFTIPYKEEDEKIIVDTYEIVRKIVDMKKRKMRIPKIARIFHNSISHISIEIALKISKETGIKDIVLSGGVFQNRIILKLLKEGLEEKGMKVYTPQHIPLNDGGIALGQIGIGRYKYGKKGIY